MIKYMLPVENSLSENFRALNSANDFKGYCVWPNIVPVASFTSDRSVVERRAGRHSLS